MEGIPIPPAGRRIDFGRLNGRVDRSWDRTIGESRRPAAANPITATPDASRRAFHKRLHERNFKSGPGTWRVRSVARRGGAAALRAAGNVPWRRLPVGERRTCACAELAAACAPKSGVPHRRRGFEAAQVLSIARRASRQVRPPASRPPRRWRSTDFASSVDPRPAWWCARDSRVRLSRPQTLLGVFQRCSGRIRTCCIRVRKPSLSKMSY